ncbi:PTS sugar transporter subunit IIA [Staphylococcus durrellii]|uniref:PTS sugar transporter subunit IIA n=1 Tax=Staphylococcus durrellii TaxID=2781773 RepID=UPI00189EC893|nr:PTS sugar transporter subunit IIA [Staphylococcus durrellii]MBF7017974.1 PTS sugar transporter subunit IIA [Staphylococcus durrellii]
MVSFKESIIKEQSILLNKNAENWEEAVAIATEPLLKNGAIEKSYIDAIIHNTKQYGPYYLLMDGMAMPHARPEDGVNRDAFSLVTFNEPVSFSDNKSASVFVVLAATSSDIHTGIAIPQIVSVFEIDNIINKLTSATTVDEILAHIDKADMSGYIA